LRLLALSRFGEADISLWEQGACDMIGHYLLTLTAEQEDRVLTQTLTPGPYYLDGECCLIGTVNDARRTYPAQFSWDVHVAWAERYDVVLRDGGHLGCLYDEFCERFTAKRINAAIRNRILSNRARRTLQHVVQELVAV
jgi:hypothetical protein